MHLICGTKGLCAWLGFPLDVVASVYGVVACLLVAFGIALLLLASLRKRPLLGMQGLLCCTIGWLLRPRAGEAFAGIHPMCYDPLRHAEGDTLCKVAILLTASVCNGEAATWQEKSKTAICSHGMRNSGAARAERYRRSWSHWLRFTTLTQLYAVESSSWPRRQLLDLPHGDRTRHRPGNASLHPSGRRRMGNETIHAYPSGRREEFENLSPVSSKIHLFQFRQGRGVGSSTGEASAVVRATQHFRNRWKAQNVTHVIKVTGKYWLPEMENWIRAFERCGCPADVLHSSRNLRSSTRQGAFWPPRGSSAPRAQCEVFGLRTDQVEAFYQDFIRRAETGSTQILEEYIAQQADEGSRWRRQLGMPPFTNALGAVAHEGSILPWL